jgi:hypothetical protein
MRYGGRTGPYAQTRPTNQVMRVRRRPEDNQHQTRTSLVPVSSGPNSVPDPPQPTPPMDFLNPAPSEEDDGQYSHLGSTRKNRIASAPLMSDPPAEHSPAARVMDPTPRNQVPDVCGQCSLERR